MFFPLLREVGTVEAALDPVFHPAVVDREPFRPGAVSKGPSDAVVIGHLPVGI
jgi:hypothetical protein